MTLAPYSLVLKLSSRRMLPQSRIPASPPSRIPDQRLRRSSHLVQDLAGGTGASRASSVADKKSMRVGAHARRPAISSEAFLFKSFEDVDAATASALLARLAACSSFFRRVRHPSSSIEYTNSSRYLPSCQVASLSLPSSTNPMF